MRRVLLVILTCCLLLSGCDMPAVTLQRERASIPLLPSEAQPVLTATPFAQPTQTKTPYPTVTPLITPRPIPTRTPEPNATPTPEPTPEPTPVVLPPELGAKTRTFADGIETVGYINIGFYLFESQEPYLNVKMSYQNGHWRGVDGFYLGDPPIRGEDYYRYMMKNHDETGGGYDSLDPKDSFFESEVLHRDMTFNVYDGSKCLGTGHISKKPVFLFGGGSMGIASEFQMDDPGIKLEKDRSYLALMGKWDPYPGKLNWNEAGDAFEIKLDGKEKILKGRFVEKNVPEFSDVLAYVEVEYMDKIYMFDLGMAYPDSMKDEKLQAYRNSIGFCDYDDDGVMEMDVDAEWAGGWSTETLSFAGNRPIYLFSDGGE